MRVLILGAHGMLGTDLVATAPPEARVIGLGHRDLDVTEPGQIARALDDHGPAWVINATAYSRVDDAEADFEAAAAVNADAPRMIGAACARVGIRVVHFSTDYVFSGQATEPYSEHAAADPVNAYGRTKLAGEQALCASGADALIVRTQWLFGAAGRSFPRTMLDRARSGLRTRVVNDQVGRPTYTVDLARATWRLIRLGARGLYHVTNGGEPATWHDVARQVFARVGRPELLSACTSQDYPTPARRPAFSVLDTRTAESLLDGSQPDWTDALGRFLTALEGEGT